MSQSKITIHRSAKVAGLLPKLPDDISRNILTRLEEGRKQKVFVSVVGHSLSHQFKFVESFFQEVSIVRSPFISSADLERLSEETAACYYAENIETLAKDNQTDATFWIIDFDTNIDEDYAQEIRQIASPVIPVIMYNRETFDLLNSRERDIDALEIKNKTEEIRTALKTFPEVFTVCPSDPVSMEPVGERFLALLSKSRKVFGGLTVSYHCLSDEAVRYAEKIYINEFSQEILPYYNTLSEEGKEEIKALLDEHFSDYISTPKAEEDIVDKIVSAASSAVTSAKTSMDSLFKTIKEKL